MTANAGDKAKSQKLHSENSTALLGPAPAIHLWLGGEGRSELQVQATFAMVTIPSSTRQVLLLSSNLRWPTRPSGRSWPHGRLPTACWQGHLWFLFCSELVSSLHKILQP